MSSLPVGFLSWQLAAIAASVVIPTLILLYLLKLRRRNLEISTTILWKKAVQDLHANAPLQKLRRNIMLLLQLLVLAALLFALAEPVLKSSSFQGQRHIILIDRSASMLSSDAAKQEDVVRLTQAKKEAIELVESLREPGLIARATNSVGDEAMIIAFDNTAEVRQGFTTNKQQLRDAINSITQSDTPTRLAEAMRLAAAQSPKLGGQTSDSQPAPAAGPPVTIHLFSDGRIPDADQARPNPKDSFVFYKVGSDKSPNLGIVNIRSQRAYDAPQKLSIFVGIESTDSIARTVEVELTIEGVVAAIKTITVPAATRPDAEATDQTGRLAGLVPATSGVVFNLEKEEAILAEVRLRPPPGSQGDLDCFATDNHAYISAPPARRLRVGLVSSGSLFLSSALSGLPLAELKIFTPAEYKAIVDKGQSPPVDVMILDGVLPPLSSNESTAGLPPGRFLIIGQVPVPKPSADSKPPITDKGKGGAAAIIDWQRSHPALRNITLDSVFISESRDVEVRSGSTASSIARTEKGPAIIELSSGATRALIIPFDVSATSWPLDVSFVVFLASAIDYLGGDTLPGQSQSTQMGAAISQILPAGASDIRLLPPPGVDEVPETALTPLPDGTVVFGPVRRAGVYRITWKGPTAPGDLQENGRSIRRIPVNLLDAQESDIAAVPQVALASRVVASSADGSFKGDRKLWQWLLAACGLLLLLEWYVYNRKVQI
ncbi:MAG: VWA domain-containing protein [Phycisphaerales bacterium]|nr:VWA domain-containing protein [Planctomycetota bacterium]